MLERSDSILNFDISFTSLWLDICANSWFILVLNDGDCCTVQYIDQGRGNATVRSNGSR